MELDRIGAGYATRGFLAAFEISRARRDDAGMTHWREVLEQIRGIASRYRVGIATILDLVTAQQNLIQAELDLVSARYTYQVTRATLAALLGREL